MELLKTQQQQANLQAEKYEVLAEGQVRYFNPLNLVPTALDGTPFFKNC